MRKSIDREDTFSISSCDLYIPIDALSYHIIYLCIFGINLIIILV